MEQKPLKLIECPRDAMQGIHTFIPTEKKVAYLNQLLKVGFDTLDFGSFVSPKAIPQLKDTALVLEQLDLTATQTKLLAIVANLRGAQDACEYREIEYLGFPFSISETFQKRNTNSSIAESLDNVLQMQDLCLRHRKKLVIYISMAFGNPYGDPWNADVAVEWTDKLYRHGIRIFAMSDTIGTSNPASIKEIISKVISAFPAAEIGAHLHSTPETQLEKLDAAWQSGCTRFDSAIHGFGGCPMAKDELTGNMSTESVLAFMQSKQIPETLDIAALNLAYQMAWDIFPH